MFFIFIFGPYFLYSIERKVLLIRVNAVPSIKLVLTLFLKGDHMSV